MRWPRIWLLKLRALVAGSRLDRDVSDELSAHLDCLTDEYIAEGLSRDRARDKALREFGGVARLSEECREARGIGWMTNAAQDFKYGIRLLVRAPGFTAAALATLALGIGATTAMFSIVYSVVLRPLPFGEPERLVALWTSDPGIGLARSNVGAADARDWRSQNTVFEGIALVRAVGNFNLVGHGEPERLQAALISANLLSVLRVSPIVGRGFAEDEDEIGHNDVVILSYALWQARFGGDPGVVGRQIMLSGVPMLVVGVMGPDFHYPSREFQIWRPLTINPEDYKTRSNHAFLSIARLKPGITIEHARSEMDVIARRLEQQYPANNRNQGIVVEPLLAGTVRSVERPLLILLAAVASMLLIGCANLVNLLLTRAMARRRELAVRTAMGAARGRLIAQSITELGPTLLAGGVLGMVLARWILDALIPWMPSDMPRVETIAVHWPVLLVSLAILALIGVLVGMWPAMEIARGQTTPLNELTRATTSAPARARVRDVLVVAQIAMTLLLLIASTLLIRSFTTLKEVDPGFRTERVLSLHIAIPRSKYTSDTAVARFCQQILERVSVMPGVEAAGMVNRLPLAGGIQIGGVRFAGVDPAVASVPNTDWRTATPEYFRAMQIPLRAGRFFTEGDTESAPLVGIIDEQLARSIWGDADPIGQRFHMGFDGAPWAVIVGVVGHIHHDSLEQDSRPQVYWNYLQRPMDRMALVVKTRNESGAMAQSIATIIREIDPEQPVYDVRTLDAVVDRSLARRWLQTTLLAVFAGLALLLATIGVYGVIAYGVGQRAREFGIRLALGARRQDLVSMVVVRGARLMSLGALIGLVAALAVSRALATLLYGVTPFDVASFAAGFGVLAIVALLACYLPARRAGRVDPTIALRAE